MTNITATKDCRVAPFGFKVIKVKKGETIQADPDNVAAWIEQKLFTPAKNSAEPKNREPKVDNTAKATAKAEKTKPKKDD